MPECNRWPSKRRYATAEQASLALRELFSERWWCVSPNLAGYACDGGDALHWHLGRLRPESRVLEGVR